MQELGVREGLRREIQAVHEALSVTSFRTGPLETLAGPFDHGSPAAGSQPLDTPSPSVGAEPAADSADAPWTPMPDDNDEWRDLPEGRQG